MCNNSHKTKQDKLDGFCYSLKRMGILSKSPRSNNQQVEESIRRTKIVNMDCALYELSPSFWWTKIIQPKLFFEQLLVWQDSNNKQGKVLPCVFSRNIFLRNIQDKKASAEIIRKMC